MNELEYSIESVSARSVSLSIKRNLYLFIKRGFDIVLSLIGVVFLIPISVIIKIAYILDKDYNSIFYTQDRIGKNGKIFRLYKYRSMIPNADDELKRILKNNKRLAKEYRINKKLRNDPRITKIGRIIRRFSVDELPQIINILKGDMSFIGNRPYLPREIDDMGQYYDDIIKTKPGLTGYWQVSGRSDVTFDYRLKLEKYYSNYCGLKMDIKIFFKTFKAVFGGKGAK
ncbi:MAG: sugar transferase [Bacilli bacterium]|nr:sugar transferase [Bacilli bacterium]